MTPPARPAPSRRSRSQGPAVAGAILVTAGLLLLSCGKNGDLVQVVIQAGVPKARTESAPGDPHALAACDMKMMLRVGAPDLFPIFKPMAGNVDSSFTGVGTGNAITITADPVSLEVKGGPDRNFSIAGALDGASCSLGGSRPIFGETQLPTLDKGVTVPVELIVSQYTFGTSVSPFSTAVMTTPDAEAVPFIVAQVPGLSNCTLSGSVNVVVEDPQGQFRFAVTGFGSSYSNPHAFYPLPPGRLYRLGYKDGASTKCCYRLAVGYRPVPGPRLENSLATRDDAFCPSGL